MAFGFSDNTNRQQIFWVTENFYPPMVDGISIQNHLLTRFLATRGLTISVITRQTMPASQYVEWIGDTRIQRLPPGGQLKGQGWRALAPMLLFLGRVLGLLLNRAHRYEVVVVIGMKLLALPVLLASMVGGKRCVIQVQSPAEVREPISAASLRKMRLTPYSPPVRIWCALRNLLLRRAARFVAVSPEIRQELIKVIGVPPNRVHYIPNGVNSERFHPVGLAEKETLRQRLGLPLEKLILVYSGRLATSKGIPLLVKTWRSLVQNHQDIHLVLVGSGGESFDSCEEDVKRLRREANLEESLTLTGAVDNVHEYLQAADIFVFPSEYEGFSLALAEAMSCGLPAVATAVGAAAELVESQRTGVLIPAQDGEALTSAIEWMLAHRETLDTMGQRAYEGAVQKCSIDAVVDAFAHMLSDLAGHKDASSANNVTAQAVVPSQETNL